MAKLKKLPEDCTFPQLAVVLDATRFAATLQAHLSPDFAARRIEILGLKVKRIYYKPARSCRVLFDAKLRDAQGRKVEQRYFAKMLPAAKLASTFRRARAGATATPVCGPAVAFVEPLGMVLWAYPNDPNLPGVAALANRAAVTAFIERDPAAFGLPAPGRLVDLRSSIGKYVPGQRCGVRFRIVWQGPEGMTERSVYGKAYQTGIGAGAWSILAQLAASDAVRSGRLRIPMPYAYDAAHEIVWQEMLPGSSFSKDASVLDLAALAGPVASSLAAFHGSPLTLGPGLGLEAEIEELEESTRKIAAAYPAYAERVQALRDRLLAAIPSLEPVPMAPTHGSFKTSHVFDAGGQVAFIDFDGAGLGDPTYDVGRFFAHLAVAGLSAKTDAANVAQAVERFRTAYAAGVAWGFPAARVHWYTAALLLSSQAYKCVKRMVPDRVAAILDGVDAWFPAR